jgi:hypothetical protein
MPCHPCRESDVEAIEDGGESGHRDPPSGAGGGMTSRRPLRPNSGQLAAHGRPNGAAAEPCGPVPHFRSDILCMSGPRQEDNAPGTHK